MKKTRTEKKMKLKSYGLICDVNGCHNTGASFVSLNGVFGGNTPNICKKCAKLIYEAMYPEAENAVNEAVDEVVDEVVDETENAVDEAAEEEETILGGIPKKKTRKKE